jgi:hypothetical protein
MLGAAEQLTRGTRKQAFYAFELVVTASAIAATAPIDYAIPAPAPTAETPGA